MTTTTDPSNRTEHLVALTTQGDEAYNPPDWATADTIHHPELVAHITGMAERSTGAKPTTPP